jgi:hypothetical protein
VDAQETSRDRKTVDSEKKREKSLFPDLKKSEVVKKFGNCRTESTKRKKSSDPVFSVFFSCFRFGVVYNDDSVQMLVFEKREKFSENREKVPES